MSARAERWRNAGALVLALAFVGLFVWLGVLWFNSDFVSGEEDDLAASLADNTGHEAAGCLPRGDGDWYWCASSFDPTSGYHRYYVLVATGDCWNAVAIEVTGKRVDEGRRFAGCTDQGGEGETMPEPDPPRDALRDDLASVREGLD